MLKNSTPDYQDSRKSVYRPVRKAKVDNKAAWDCLSINWPLDIVTKVFIVFDLFRGILDTTFIVVLLFFILEIEYHDIMVVHNNFIKSFKGMNATVFTSVSKREYARFFKHSKHTLVILLGITSFFVATEVPLAGYLFKAIRNKEKSSLIIWKQIAMVSIFFNFICFTAILVYTAKAGMILDNETWVSKSGTNMRVLIYMVILRTSTFDLTKGCEIVIVNAFYREVVRKKKVVSMVEEVDEDHEYDHEYDHESMSP